MARGGVTIEVRGLRQLGEKLRDLDADIQQKIARATTNAMAQVIKKLAAQKAPVADEDYRVYDKNGGSVLVPRGNLPKKISVKYLGQKTGLTSEHIVFIKGKRKDGYANRIGVLKEFGTVAGKPHSHGSAPEPFMRPALAQGASAAIAAGKKRLKARIDKANRDAKKATT